MGKTMNGKNKKIALGLNAAGILRITQWDNGNYINYTTQFSRKDNNEEWHNYQCRVKFPKSIDPPAFDRKDNAIIMVNKAFFSVDFWTDKKTKKEVTAPVLWVQDYEEYEDKV